MDGSQFPITAGDRMASRRYRRSLSWRTLLIGFGVLLGLGLATAYGNYYWTTGRFLVSTDDATVQADSVIISPRVSGYIDRVLVQDNQHVHAGQVLALIDDRDYRTAVDAAQAEVQQAQAAIADLQQQIDAQQLSVDQANATVSADRASLTFSREQASRYSQLSRNGAATIQDSQQWSADVLQKEALLTRDTAAIGVAGKQVDVLKAAFAQAQGTLLQQQAALHQAELNLGYTTITAPIDGTVGVRTLRVGQYVQAGTQLMAIVPLHAVYVVANYEETQLTDVFSGQPVTIAVDTFPDAKVHGFVNSIAPASGEEFALLPPDNATGNYVKIVQRIPVKITIDPKDPLLGRLRPGMSVEPTIDTRHA